MPELPEIETLVLQLKRILEGKVISNVEIRNPSILKAPKKEFEEKLIGKKVTQIKRRGKYIRTDLSENVILWFHLGMTGQLLFESSVGFPKPHTHFILSFAGFKKKLFYRDVRRFGRIALSPSEESKFPEGVRRLGLEPSDWDQKAFISLFKERRGRIKNLLLNQALMAGIGNIYADESLYRAGIRPFRRACQVGPQGLGRLHTAVCELLEEAIRWGGSSIDDYLHLDGTTGNFQNFHRVYGRGGEGCRSCGTEIRTIKLSGRSSSFCPHCQK